MSNYLDTRLTPEQEANFQVWRARLPDHLRGSSDYDLRGAYLENAQQSADAHLTDRYKKPNHQTFSNQSIYAPLAPHMAGDWNEDDSYNPSMLRALSNALMNGGK